MNSCGINKPDIETENKNYNTTIDSSFVSRLKNAAIIAKRELEIVRGIPSTIEILNQKNKSIIIDEISYHNDPSKKYLVVYGGEQSIAEPLFMDEIGKLRYVYLRNLTECRIFVKCKLLRIMFHECNKCQISLRSPVVGMAEFFHCQSTNINIRIPDGEIPLTRIESCKNLHIFQSNDCLVYLIYMSVDIDGTIIDQNSGARQIDYQLGKLFWDDQCQIFVCLSREEGFASIPMNYILNDLTHHIIVKSPNLYPENNSPYLMENTPPVDNREGAWETYLKVKQEQ